MVSKRMNHIPLRKVSSHFTDVETKAQTQRDVATGAQREVAVLGIALPCTYSCPTPTWPTWMWVWCTVATQVHAATCHLLQPRHVHSCEPRQGLQVPGKVVIASGGGQEPAGGTGARAGRGAQAGSWGITLTSGITPSPSPPQASLNHTASSHSLLHLPT